MLCLLIPTVKFAIPFNKPLYQIQPRQNKLQLHHLTDSGNLQYSFWWQLVSYFTLAQSKRNKQTVNKTSQPNHTHSLLLPIVVLVQFGNALIPFPLQVTTWIHRNPPLPVKVSVMKSEIFKWLSLWIILRWLKN